MTHQERKTKTAQQSADKLEQVVHDLHVHQVELEAQNRALSDAQIELEESRDQYIDLFDFAPVGYMSMDKHGCIQEMNLTAAALLGKERHYVLGKPLVNYVAKADVNAFLHHLYQCTQGQEKVSTELGLVHKEHGIISVQLYSLSAGQDPRRRKLWRTVISDISEQKRAERALQDGAAQLRELSTHLQSVREEEKANIAREIHDELGSSLTALKMDIAWLSSQLTKRQGRLKEKAHAMSNLVDSTIKTVRDIVTALRPSVLDHLGLMSAIEVHVNEFQKNTGIEVKLSLHPRELELDEIRSIALFRLVQEALTNIMRHANASQVEISCIQERHNIVLTISDNGCGIKPEQIANLTSHGIHGMFERAQYLQGAIRISGTSGKGTLITARIPRLQQKAKAL